MIPIFDSSVYDWGIQVISSVQAVKNSALTLIMLFISFLSDPLAYLCALPIIFWCVDTKKGFSVAIIVLFSASINTSLKDLLQVPRPYEVKPAIGLDTVDGFSTPSGHSQNSATFWPYVTSLFVNKQKAIKVLLSFLPPFLIGFSRIYLGVHYPTDVLLGWALGLVIFCGAVLFLPKISFCLGRLPKSIKILIAGLFGILLTKINPLDTSMPAAFFGLGIGYVYLCESGGYDAKNGTVKEKVLRIILGLFVLGLLYVGLKVVFPGEGDQNYQLFRFIRYGALGFFGSFILPKIFISMKIASKIKADE